MKFYNHCTQELSDEAKRVISNETWHPDYKKQLLCRVEDMLEAGNWIQTEHGNSIPFIISDIESIVKIVSDRD